MAECAFGGVVGWLNTFDLGECPQPISATVKFLAHPVQLHIATETTAQQQAIELGANWRDRLAK